MTLRGSNVLTRPNAVRRLLDPVVTRWIWPPDKAERLSTVARLVGDPSEVLDLGGRGRELARLLHGSHVTSANVEQPCDVQVLPDRPLPFANNAFDAVTSTDVLEHVPPEERARFLGEAIRVARSRVVLCFPAGSIAKRDAEASLSHELATLGVRLDFLEEHIALGLPTADEVVDMTVLLAPRARVRSYVTGTIGHGDRLLLAAMRLRHRLDVRVLPEVLRGWTQRRAAVLETTARPDSDRAYVVIDLT